jgi:hypothetical protein
MCQIPPEKIGVPREAVFTVPLEDGSSILVILPLTSARTVRKRAAAAGMQPGDYLAALANKGASNPRNPWNLLPPS